MGALLLLTGSATEPGEVLPGLALLGHPVLTRPLDVAALLERPSAEVVLVDGRDRMVEAKALCRLVRATGSSRPLILVLPEGGWAAVSADWEVDDVLSAGAMPDEVAARLRLAVGRAGPALAARAPGGHRSDGAIRCGGLVIDESTYTCRLHSRQLDLTFKEFELLKHLALHPGRVFTRAALLHEVWGDDYYGGTRTVDVHVRRLRAKLGPEHDSLIGTVRNVGYKLVAAPGAERASAGADPVEVLTG